MKYRQIWCCDSHEFLRCHSGILFQHRPEIAGGVEYRSRYWLKYTFKDDKPVKSHVPVPTKDQLFYMARCNCIHSLTEYNHLASILPSLYDEMGGRIE